MKELIFELSNAEEKNIFNIISRELSDFCEVTKDKSGNIYAIMSNKSTNILYDAHIDEIGFVVTNIDEDGFLTVANVGGVDRRTLTAHRVTIYGKEPILGIFCSVPPHLSGEEDRKKLPKISDMKIDTGLGKKAVDLISLGDIVRLNSTPLELLNNTISSKAFDDRAGVASLIHCAKLLKDKQLSCGVTFLFSTLEEVGQRGVKTAGYNMDFDEVIAVDVSFGYTPDAPRHKTGEVSKGPMIGCSPTLTREITDSFKQLAVDNKIDYQLEIMGGDTSTNVDYLSISKSGALSGLLSIPLKYMHTSIETISIDDALNVGKLLALYAQKRSEK